MVVLNRVCGAYKGCFVKKVAEEECRRVDMVWYT
jgi:hypothetical protein